MCIRDRSDTGAYASLGGPVLQRACTHAAGPYNYQNIDITGKAYYTNNPPAGAFRGFGVTQSCFATECNLNKLAEIVGISPFEIRRRNALKPGDIMPNGQIADETTAIAVSYTHLHLINGFMIILLSNLNYIIKGTIKSHTYSL